MTRLLGTFCHRNFFVHANIFFGLVKPYRIHCVFKSHAIGKTRFCWRIDDYIPLCLSNEAEPRQKFRPLGRWASARTSTCLPSPFHAFYLDAIEETYK